VSKSTDTATGPKADIEDSSLSGDEKKRADATLVLVKAGTSFEAHPWVKQETDNNTQNPGKVPNRVKKGFKWAWAHKNIDGYLPGTPGAGGYLEYYICLDDDQKGGPTDAERLVISTGGDGFHTDTHYGDHGAPAFTHFAKP
jgi:hypothetical protein